MILLDQILNTKSVEKIEYKRIGEKSLKILLRKPADWEEGQDRTAIIWIHGGGWERGEAEMFLPHIEYFARRGAVTFSIEYRLAGQNGLTVEDCLQDCIDCIKYLRRNASIFGIDSEKLVVGGDSAGGHIANCIGSPEIFGYGVEEMPPVNCVINCNGIIDMTMKWKSTLYNQKIDAHNTSIEEWSNYYERCRRISPVFNITKTNAPTLILQGLEDSVVEPEEAMRYYYALKKCGVDTEIQLIRGVGHAFILFNYQLENKKVFKVLQSIDGYLVARGLLPKL